MIFYIFFLILLIFILFLNRGKHFKNDIAMNHYRNVKLLPWLEGIPNYHYHGTSKTEKYNLKESLEIDMKNLIKNHIKNNDKVLDIGCGFCGFNKLVNEIYDEAILMGVDKKQIEEVIYNIATNLKTELKG